MSILPPDALVSYPNVPYPDNIQFIYAGGLNPDNIIREIDKLNYVTKMSGLTKFAIDMESGIRTNNSFDIDKVKSIIDQYLQYDSIRNKSNPVSTKHTLW